MTAISPEKKPPLEFDAVYKKINDHIHSRLRGDIDFLNSQKFWEYILDNAEKKNVAEALSIVISHHDYQEVRRCRHCCGCK